MFSDILTPLPAMGVDFAISEAGGINISPIRTREEFKKMLAKPFEPEKQVPFVGDTLTKIREKVARAHCTASAFCR